MPVSSGNLWAITSYFNPVGYRRRLENYRAFRSRLTVPLVAVELSCGEQFHLDPDSAERLIQLCGRDVMWQKERLLNMALQALPSCCDKVVWLDCDVVFQRPDWAERTAEALERVALIQPFHRAFDLSPNVGPDTASSDAAALMGHSLIYLRATGQASDRLLRGNMRLGQRCHSGLAWAARREVLERTGFYDACILGSGNRVMVCAALEQFQDGVDYLQMNASWKKHYLTWARAHCNLVRGNVGYVEGDMLHLWHGDLRLRRYQERHHGLRGFAFDPATDLALDDNGCWRWDSAKPEMHRYVRDYFASRHEDG